jgi:hypothetical protein
MRGTWTKAAAIGLLAAGAAMPPTAAQAGPRANYRQAFSTPVPGASAGTDTQIVYKNPADPKAKPIPVRREVFTFPKGTGFDNSVVPECDASDLEVQLEGVAACPPASRTGGGRGDTSMTGFPGAGDTQLQVDGFNYASGTLLIGQPKGFPLRFPTRAVRRGRVITVNVPRTPGGPPDGESALHRVHNVFGARSRGRRAYTRTPRSCPSSGVWTFSARFTFADGAVEHDVYRMPCHRSRPHRKLSS